MNILHVSISMTALAATVLGFVGVAGAQEQQRQLDPRPATSETEGTAADRTAPNQRATRPATPADTQTDPRPATNPAEGTAADRTPPGSTSTTGPASGQSQRSELVGATVVTPNGAAIGEVVDVVFDSVSKPAFVVIASDGAASAVPYSVASSMKSGDKVVMDQSKLKSAPKMKQGEWRSKSSENWKSDSSRYWNKG
jgi:sporulation protein YlmC with PRC-barrel domain